MNWQNTHPLCLHPEYGLPATVRFDPNAGLSCFMRKLATIQLALNVWLALDCLDVWSAKRIKEQGADAVLLYYDVDSADELNQEKQAYIERIGSECAAEDIHSSLKSGLRWKIRWCWLCRIRKVKPQGWVGASESLLSDPRFNIDVLKGSSSQRQHVEGFWRWWNRAYCGRSGSFLQSASDEATNLPCYSFWVRVYQLNSSRNACLAHESGANFNGKPFVAVQLGLDQLKPTSKMWSSSFVSGCTTDLENIDELNKVLQTTATSWKERKAFPNLRNIDLNKN